MVAVIVDYVEKSQHVVDHGHMGCNDGGAGEAAEHRVRLGGENGDPGARRIVVLNELATLSFPHHAEGVAVDRCFYGPRPITEVEADTPEVLSHGDSINVAPKGTERRGGPRCAPPLEAVHSGEIKDSAPVNITGRSGKHHGEKRGDPNGMLFSPADAVWNNEGNGYV